MNTQIATFNNSPAVKRNNKMIFIQQISSSPAQFTRTCHWDYNWPKQKIRTKHKQSIQWFFCCLLLLLRYTRSLESVRMWFFCLIRTVHVESFDLILRSNGFSVVWCPIRFLLLQSRYSSLSLLRSLWVWAAHIHADRIVCYTEKPVLFRSVFVYIGLNSLGV